MAKLTRVTAKIFGETADATLADPEIGQFGSAKAGTYNGTGDIAIIQSLAAWSNGWIDAVTPTQQFPPLPEMTGVHKVLSQQIAYTLQQGVPEWDSATTYYTNNFCSKAGKIYISQSDNNLNNDPESDTVNWQEFTNGSSRNIGEIVTSTTPLTDAGLHLLDGALLQYGSYKDVIDYYADLYSTMPKTSRVNVIGTLTDIDGVLSGFSVSNYCYPNMGQSFANVASSASSWEEVYKFKITNNTTTQNITGGNSGTYIHDIFVLNTSKFSINLSSNGSSYDIANSISGSHTVQTNTDYWVKLEFTGTQYILSYSLDGETYTPDITITNSTHIENTSDINYIGCRGDLGQPLLGTIDLTESYININSSRWWTGRMPVIFTDETMWQQSVTTYGVCGKFVYDSVANTVRLPKYSNKIYTKDISSTAPVVGNGNALRFYDGSDTLNLGNRRGYDGTAHFGGNSSNIGNGVSSNNGTGTVTSYAVGLVTSPSNSGVIAQLSNITTSLEGYYYIVIATTTKTDIQVDIDQIATDLNGKADVDLTNVNNAGTSKGAGWAMPSDTYEALTIGASGTTYTMPANGWLGISGDATSSQCYVTDTTEAYINWCTAGVTNGNFLTIPVRKGQVIGFKWLNYNPTLLRFTYAVGSESEA